MKENNVSIPIRLNEEFVDNMKSNGNHSSKYYEQLLYSSLGTKEELETINSYLQDIYLLTPAKINTLNSYQVDQLISRLKNLKIHLQNTLNIDSDAETVKVDIYLPEDSEFNELTSKEISRILNC